MRATMHNGKGFAKHNDRDFSVEHAEHIDPTKVRENLYMCFCGKPGQTFEQAERQFYSDSFSGWADDRNERSARQHHHDRDVTTDDIYKSKKSCPDESIIQLGDKDNSASADVLRAVVDDFKAWHDKRFAGDGAEIKILDMALHLDETTPHFHKRQVYTYTDRDGLQKVGMDKCLERLGVPLRDPEKPKSRSNNRKQVYTQMCRDRFIELAKAHGLDIIEQPAHRAPSKQNLVKNDFILAQQDERIVANSQEILRQDDTLQKTLQQAQQVQDSIDSDKAQAAEVFGHVRAAVVGVDALQGWSPKVISETPEKKRFGKVDPATVTISRDDLDRVKQVSDAGAVVEGYNQAVTALQDVQIDLYKTARQVHMTAKQSYEVGVDARVLEADNRTAQAEKRAQDAERRAQAEAKARQAAEHDRDQALEREQQAQQQLSLYLDTLSFFPDDWKRMKERTTRVLEMERLYFKAQELPRGESAPGLEYNQWMGGYSYQLSDGACYDRRHLLKEYVAECRKQDVPHDPVMWEDAQKAIKSLEHDRGWSR